MGGGGGRGEDNTPRYTYNMSGATVSALVENQAGEGDRVKGERLPRMRLSLGVKLADGMCESECLFVWVA